MLRKLATFNEEILYVKLYFWCNDPCINHLTKDLLFSFRASFDKDLNKTLQNDCVIGSFPLVLGLLSLFRTEKLEEKQSICDQ